MKLQKITLFYANVVVDNSWVDVSQKSDPILWNLQINDDTDQSNAKQETDRGYIGN